MRVVFERSYYSSAVHICASMGSKTKINTKLPPKQHTQSTVGGSGARDGGGRTHIEKK